jgi:hypothetical protein
MQIRGRLGRHVDDFEVLDRDGCFILSSTKYIESFDDTHRFHRDGPERKYGKTNSSNGPAMCGEHRV